MWIRVLKISGKVVGGIIVLMLLISALLLIFKDNIKGYALEEANKHLNKRVHIGYIDVGIWGTFPDMSLDFDDVLVHSKFDTLQTVDTAFYAQKLRLRFNPFDFFSGNYNVHKIEVSDAQLNMHIQEDGKVNYDFLKPAEGEPTNFAFSLEQIVLQRTHYTYLNKATGQDYASFIDDMTLKGDFTNEEFLLDAKMKLNIEHITNKSLTLISNKQATCDIAIQMDQVNSIFEIKSANLTINKLPFFIRGKVTKDSLDFYFSGEKLELTDVAKNFTVDELGLVDELNGTGTFNIDVAIAGPLENTSSPSIEANFHVENGSLKDKGFEIKKIRLDGHYSNGIASKQEELTINTLSFNTLGNDFNGNVSITDFTQPRLKGKAKGKLDLTAVHRLFGSFGMSHLSGNIDLNGQFDFRFNNPKFDPLNLTIYDVRTNFSLHQIAAQQIGDSRVFTIPSGDIVLRNQQAGFKHLFIKIANSDIVLDGTVNNIADYFKKTGKLEVDASIESTRLDLADLSTTTEGEKTRSWLLPSDISGQLTLGLQTVNYGGHIYSEIKTRLKFGDKVLKFPALTAKNAGADISGSLVIEETLPMLLTVSTQLSSPNVHFDKLFKEWHNFDQTTITSDNIKGVAAVQLNFSGPFNLFTGEDLKNQFTSKINIRIKNGALVNVSTFKEITESIKESSARLVISKKHINAFEKELLNLRFETFENEITIANGVLTIPKMEIKSNALDVRLSGTHSFLNQVDYSFDFRFREIKSAASNSEFGDVVDDGSGFRVYLRMYGDLFDPNFAWDKDAKKADKQKEKEEAKDDLKSVLKEGFGINKKDTTIRDIPAEKKRQEQLIMDFNREKDSLDQEFDPDKKTKKKSKWGSVIDGWKQENEKEKEKESFDVDGK
jgi:hypothetical protein